MLNRKYWGRTISVMLLLTLWLAACNSSGGAATPTPGGSSHHVIGQQTKTSGCVAHDALPDSDCTPGAVFSDVTKDQVCVSGYSTSVRNVPESEKNQVYAEYGVKSHTTGEYEVDHLISLELGGSNDIANLWPEPAEPRPGFHEKDKVENYLHQQVCSGAMSLADAQAIIATDWMSVYNQLPK
ncbi:MAG TPA: HNH endonuclease [Anaerolineae bacterium]|nr:HNH endonuclease [Anaerolineae bacterium]